MQKFLRFNILFRWLICAGLCLLPHSLKFTLAQAGSYIESGITITVTTTIDELNTDGDCSLREALRAANLNIAVDKCPAGTGTDTIFLLPGTYKLTKLGAGEDAGLTGDLDITSPLSIAGTSQATTIIDGQASDRVFHVTNNVSVTFANLTIRNGSAPASGYYGGGGILNNGIIIITHCLITQNTAVSIGGGIENIGSASLFNVTFSYNQAANGGGIFNENALMIDGATFTNNSSSMTGGGLDNNNDATLINATFSANTSPLGGGVFNDANLTMYNLTITANNSGLHNSSGIIRSRNTIIANSTDEINCTGDGITSLGHNLESANTCKLVGVGDLINTDPLLSPLQDNGGATHTHALLSDSDAIDAGDNFDCPMRDQRGAYRPADGDTDSSVVCDIGAYEYAATFPHYTFLPMLFRH